MYAINIRVRRLYQKKMKNCSKNFFASARRVYRYYWTSLGPENSIFNILCLPRTIVADVVSAENLFPNTFIGSAFKKNCIDARYLTLRCRKKTGFLESPE